MFLKNIFKNAFDPDMMPFLGDRNVDTSLTLGSYLCLLVNDNKDNYSVISQYKNSAMIALFQLADVPHLKARATFKGVNYEISLVNDDQKSHTPEALSDLHIYCPTPNQAKDTTLRKSVYVKALNVADHNTIVEIGLFAQSFYMDNLRYVYFPQAMVILLGLYYILNDMSEQKADHSNIHIGDVTYHGNTVPDIFVAINVEGKEHIDITEGVSTLSVDYPIVSPEDKEKYDTLQKALSDPDIKLIEFSVNKNKDTVKNITIKYVKKEEEKSH